MKKILGIIIFGLMWCSSSFALSPEREKIEYNSCYEDMTETYADFSAKQYCTCSVEKISKKYSDKKMDKIISKGWDYMMKKIKFAADYCKKEVLLVGKPPKHIYLTCYMNNPDGAFLSPHSLTLMPDAKMFKLHSFNVLGNNLEIYSGAYRGSVAHDGFITKFILDRNNGRIIYTISKQSGGVENNHIGSCEMATKGTKF